MGLAFVKGGGAAQSLKEALMATFIVLANFTEKGVHAAKDTIGRAEKFKEMAKKAGVTVKEMYWTSDPGTWSPFARPQTTILRPHCR